MDPIAIATLIAIVAKMIVECRKDGRTDEQIRTALMANRLGAIPELRLRRHVRMSLGMSPLEWLKKGEPIMEQVHKDRLELTATDIDEVFSMADATAEAE